MDDFNLTFNYYYTSIGIIGMSRTGKTYLTTKLAATAGKHCSVLVHSPKLKNTYSKVSNDIKMPAPDQLTAQMVDNFIDLRKDKRYWLLVFDDLDVFVHNSKESRYLETLPMINKGHWNQGCIWQSRRMVNLPKGIYQNSDYLIFAYGVDPYDYDDLQKYAGLDIELYKSMPEPVHDPKDPQTVLSAHYLILDRTSIPYKQRIFKHVQGLF